MEPIKINNKRSNFWHTSMTAFLWMVILLTIQVSLGQGHLQNVYFDDSGSNIVVGSDDYEIAFRKRDGGIVYIEDKSTDRFVSTGSLNGCIWVIVFDYQSTPADYIESCSYTPEGANRFDYHWLPASRQLILNYTPDPAATQSVDVTITVTPSASAWFDLNFSLINNWGYVPEDVKFPADLIFARNDMEEVLIPVLPGVILESGFFSRGQKYEESYPGTMFADFISIKSINGRLAMYSVPTSDVIVPAYLGLFFENCANNATVCLTHNLKSGVRPGAAWFSPTVRFRVGEDYFDTIQAFRQDSGVAGFQSIESKLGALYSQVTQSPLYKADLGGGPPPGGISFGELPDRLSDEIAYPGILHLVAYWQRGFDENYPDFLGPDSDLGTLGEMVDMMNQVQSMGYLVMPYINPTWWDDESPTVREDLPPLNIEDIAVLDRQGNPKFENYGDHVGFIVSPYPEFVQERLENLMRDMTQMIPSDLIHEDQVGGRAAHPDYNPASPHPAAYSQGWLEHTRTFSHLLLTSEMGFDRLAETETGFHGSVLLAEAENKTSNWWGDDNWHLYPLAPILLRDKVLLYHNTENRSATDEKRVLAMNLGFGYMLSFDWTAPEADTKWLDPVGAFQSKVISKYAGEQITEYIYLTDDVSQTTFETIITVINWNQLSSFSAGDFDIAPLGAMVESDDGSLRAGVFTKYNGVNLRVGDHYLIEERGINQIVVQQPLGSDTLLAVRALPNWDNTRPVTIWVYDQNGQIIDRTHSDIVADKINFEYSLHLSGEPVGSYIIFQATSLYLPLLLRD